TWDQVKPLIDRVRATPLTHREQADTTEGVPLGVHAVNPVNGEAVPCFVAPYVLMEYGTGAIMAVPAHDERDFAFARAHAVAVPDDQLPVLLPEDVDFQPGGESPLARHPTWKKVTCPNCGGDAERDTDTMDTFVDSSWYLFRYCSPGYDGGPFRTEDVERW